jgi:dTDP-4-dehydrorhamnose reductase
VIAVTGSNGQLGTAFGSLLPDAAHLTRADLDLSRSDSIAGVLDRLSPELVLNCAAYTAVDRAEEEEDLATAVNGLAVGEMARWCARNGARFVTFSTDYVFDGAAGTPYLESSDTDPVNAYGRSKLVGEQAMLEAGGDALVVRTSWVISATHPNFVATMLRLAPERELRVVDDQWGCPTIASDLARATLEAVGASATGVLHLTNSGPTTWYRLAQEALRRAGIPEDRLAPCTSSDYPTPAARPAYSVLGSERRIELGISGLPHWEESLDEVVRRLLDHPPA